MRIDSHQHFWDISRSGYDWLTPDLDVLFRNYGPDELAPILMQEGIDGTILVQAAPAVEETLYLLKIATETPFVFGVVGWVDLSGQGAAYIVKTLSANPCLKGLRPMLQDIEQTDWILREDLRPALEEMQTAGLVFDALIKQRHLGVMKIFAANYPKLKIVIDHAAKPDFQDDTYAVWAKAMTDLSQFENVYCKLSGLWTETPDNVSDDVLEPYVQHLVSSFGSGKLMWGSDWPVLKVAGEYCDWLGQAKRLLSEIDGFNLESCFGKTAERFYGI